MNKLIAVIALLVTTCAYAADDLVNCRRENGDEIEYEVCSTERDNLPTEELEVVEKAIQERDAKYEDDRIKRCAKAKRRPLTEREKSAISVTIRDMLKDPDSAKFKWVKLVKDNAPSEYCGLVNAKNSYGGYTGYTYFHLVLRYGKSGAITANLAMLADHDDDERFKNIWCKSACYDDFTQAKP